MISWQKITDKQPFIPQGRLASDTLLFACDDGKVYAGKYYQPDGCFLTMDVFDGVSARTALSPNNIWIPGKLIATLWAYLPLHPIKK